MKDLAFLKIRSDAPVSADDNDIEFDGADLKAIDGRERKWQDLTKIMVISFEGIDEYLWPI